MKRYPLMTFPKYRAWDRFNKEMVAVVDMSWKGGQITEINTETYVHFPLESHTCELMRYIGRKDENGEELFLWDFVSWDGGEYEIMESELDGGIIMKDDRDDYACPTLYAQTLVGTDRTRVKLIGNRFEKKYGSLTKEEKS